MRKIAWISWACGLLAAGCDPAEEPTLCVFGTAELAGKTGPTDPTLCGEDKPASAEGAARACEGFTIGADRVIFVRHTLPAGIEVDDKLAVHLQTPCAPLNEAADVTLEIEHAGGVALLSLVAPPGAECALSVTATIAGNETRCDSARDTAQCSELATRCEPEEGGSGQ